MLIPCNIFARLSTDLGSVPFSKLFVKEGVFRYIFSVLFNLLCLFLIESMNSLFTSQFEIFLLNFSAVIIFFNVFSIDLDLFSQIDFETNEILFELQNELKFDIALQKQNSLILSLLRIY